MTLPTPPEGRSYASTPLSPASPRSPISPVFKVPDVPRGLGRGSLGEGSGSGSRSRTASTSASVSGTVPTTRTSRAVSGASVASFTSVGSAASFATAASELGSGSGYAGPALSSSASTITNGNGNPGTSASTSHMRRSRSATGLSARGSGLGGKPSKSNRHVSTPSNSSWTGTMAVPSTGRAPSIVVDRPDDDTDADADTRSIASLSSFSSLPSHSASRTSAARDKDDDAASTRSRFSFSFSEFDDDLDDADDNEYELDAAAEPLVGTVRRRRKKWDDETGDQSLLEIIAPLLLSHPLALLPALSAVPHDFLPAGVALFVPLFCVLALLSACAHIVIVYLAWYLKVRTFEDVFAACVGERFGRYGLGVGRAFVLVSTIGASIGWLGTLYPLLEPIATSYLPDGFLHARLTWTIFVCILLAPALVPRRSYRPLRFVPLALALLLPVVTFIAIGRTSEIKKAAEEAAAAAAAAAGSEAANGTEVASGVADVATTAAATATEAVKDALKRSLNLRKISVRGLSAKSAGAGLTTLAMFFTPHLQTLPIHSTLARAQRQKFGIPILAITSIITILALPLALVPYYLLPEAPTVFAALPADDGWTNFARALMAAVVLGSTATWLLRGRDTVLTALDVDRGERYKAGRWVGIGIWAIVVLFACIGGWVADKIELMGVMATLAVGWLLPSVFFIITFHVRSPLAIIFPSHGPPPMDEEALLPTGSSGSGSSGSRHSRSPSISDPSTDILLARKERQLQKRRLGRRLWQDLIVYVGILPVGVVTLVWCVGSFVGLW